MKEIDDLREKAKRFLRTAELSLNDGDYDSCASRCYYAMFFVTEALLLTKNLRASSHKGVIILFGEHFIKTELIRKGSGKMLRRAYDLRQKGDYAIGFMVNENDARDMLKGAKEFVKEVGVYLQSKGTDEE